MREWEVWFAEFPYEEDKLIVKNRPVIILNVEPLEVLTVKVTSHEQRKKDDYDVPIIHWNYCGLKRPSIARVAKSIYLTYDKFSIKLGELHKDDQEAIFRKYIEYIKSIKT